MPILFLHLNTEMIGSLLNIGKREITFCVGDVFDLIESCHCIAHMGSIRHGLFAGARKRKDRRRQCIFLGCGKPAMRRRAIGLPGCFWHIVMIYYKVKNNEADKAGGTRVGHRAKSILRRAFLTLRRKHFASQVKGRNFTSMKNNKSPIL